MLDLRKKGVRYKLDVISHSFTLDLKMRDGQKRGMRYQPEVHVLPREYGIWQNTVHVWRVVLTGQQVGSYLAVM